MHGSGNYVGREPWQAPIRAVTMARHVPAGIGDRALVKSPEKVGAARPDIDRSRAAIQARCERGRRGRRASFGRGDGQQAGRALCLLTGSPMPLHVTSERKGRSIGRAWDLMLLAAVIETRSRAGDTSPPTPWSSGGSTQHTLATTPTSKTSSQSMLPTIRALRFSSPPDYGMPRQFGTISSTPRQLARALDVL